MVTQFSSMIFSAVDQLNLTSWGKPNTESRLSLRNFLVAGSVIQKAVVYIIVNWRCRFLPAGYPLPQPSPVMSMFSLNCQLLTALSLLTLAQILAALTTGNRASAFLDTVILMPGNLLLSLS
jgi:hypothetical protein